MLNQTNDVKKLMESGLRGLLSVQQWAHLGRRMDGYAPPYVAKFLGRFDFATRSVVFRALPRNHASEVFGYLEPERQEALLHDLTGAQTRELLASLSPDDRASLLAELPANMTQRLLTTLSSGDLAEAQQLLGHPEDSVGRLMTPDFVRVRADGTVAEGLAHIRRYGRNAETLDAIYIIDAAGHLIDDLDLRVFVLADPAEMVASLMDEVYVALHASDDREEAVRVMKRYDRVALPVIDSDGKLLGIVTADDVFDVDEEEATEDFQKMGGSEDGWYGSPRHAIYADRDSGDDPETRRLARRPLPWGDADCYGDGLFRR